MIELSKVEIGIDLVDHDKFRRFTPDDFPRFYQKVFTVQELTFCRDRPVSFAGIFAAKEAVLKSVTGFGRTYLSQFEIDHVQRRPVVRDRYHHHPVGLVELDGKLIRIKLSISHGKDHSIAFAIASAGEEYHY